MKVFNKNNFMIHSLAPKADITYGQNIHITNDFTEVTNGHYLIRVYCKKGDKSDIPATENLKPSEEKIDAIISAESAREIERAIPKNHHIEILNSAWIGKNTNEEQVEFICTDLETWRPIVTKKIGGKFPSAETAIPKEKPEIEIGFNAGYMEKLCQQFKKADIKTIKMSIYGDIHAIKLEGENTDRDQEIMALLMPVKL